MSSCLKILFVCGRNQWRSPTAEAIYRDDLRVDARSAGVSESARRRVSAKDLAWADLVVVMERKHGARIKERFGAEMQLPPIESLEIPDDYQFMDTELIDLIREGVEEQLAKTT